MVNLKESLRVSILQMNSSSRHQPNIEAVSSAAQIAATERAELLALPEGSGMMNRDREASGKLIATEENDAFIKACRSLASEHGLWIHLGSTPVATADGRRKNRTLLIDNLGQVRARYDKIHLFDVFLPDRPPTGESKRYDAGKRAVVVDTPWGAWGLSICYDLRFPHLYRTYAQSGAVILFVPSAFTVPTGEAHWETLLKARAIENGAWVIAAAQAGEHEDGRTTYGHSMIVSPWGTIKADLGGDQSRQMTIEIDLGEADTARARIPSLANERRYEFHRIDARIN